MFDITTFSSILLHIRDPFLALQNGAKHTKDIIIVTERLFRPGWTSPFGNLFQTHFFPDHRGSGLRGFGDSWWRLSPSLIRRFIGVLGFEKTKTNFHLQSNLGRKKPMFTIVGYRTKKVSK